MLNMHNNLKILILKIFSILLSTATANAQTGQFKISSHWESLPDFPDSSGRSGMISGVIDNEVMVIGGTNFPDKPLSKGGTKKYYAEAFALRKDSSNHFNWIHAFDFPYPVAYGASVNFAGGMICIGGNNTQMNSNKVHLITKQGNEFKIGELPSMPFPLSKMVAVENENIVFVAGGISGNEESKKMLKLDLNKRYSDDFGWEVLGNMPGDPRVEATASVQNDGEETAIYIFGGYTMSGRNNFPLVHTDGLIFYPDRNEWRHFSNSYPDKKTFALLGSRSIPVGVHNIMVTGGVDRSRFQAALDRIYLIDSPATDPVLKDSLIRIQNSYFDHPPDWYDYNNNVLIFNTISREWTVQDRYPYQPVTGGVLQKIDQSYYLISGEIKPGVRTNKCYLLVFDYIPRFGLANWIVLIVYLGAMIFIGYLFMRKKGGTFQFFKGSGRIPWWAAGMSIFATMLSAITFMAIPAVTYTRDWRYFILAITIFLISFPVVRYYLPFFRKLNVTTAYEYLEVRFNALSRVLASSLFIIFMVVRMAMVLYLPSLALTTVTGIDLYTCIILMRVITLIYCTMGGVEAVIWGDVVQGFVLMGGALLSIVFLIHDTKGGVGEAFNMAIDNNKFHVLNMAFNLSEPTFWVVFVGGLAINLISYSSDQAIIQRYMTTSSERKAGNSILFNGVLSVLISIVFYSIGTLMFTYYKTNPGQLNFLIENPDSIYPNFIMSQMPVGIAGLMISAIFAATMSTVSTNINSLSTAFTVDIYKKLRPGKEDNILLFIARFSGIILGSVGIGFALLMASMNILSIFDFFNTVIGLISSGVAGLFLMGIFIPRIGPRSAVTGFIAGTIILYFISINTSVHGFLYGFIGLAGSVLIGFILSFIIPEKKKNIAGLTIQTMRESASHKY